MELKRAHEIVSAMVQHNLLPIFGRGGEEIPELLRDVSLSDMLEAQRVVKAHDDARADGKCHVICDDRLVAAYYTFIHYPPRRSRSGMYEPIVYTKSRALVCCDSASFQSDAEGE